MGGKGSGNFTHHNRKQPQIVNKPAGVNTRNLTLALEAWNLPRVDTKNPAAIEERMEMYLRHCAEHDIAPSVSGCTAWLGIYKDTLQDYYQGRIGTPEHQIVATKFYNVLQNVWSMDMHEGNINPVSGIFIGKTFFGYKDTQDIVISNGNASQDRLSNAELIAESKRLPGADTLEIPQITEVTEAPKMVEVTEVTQTEEPIVEDVCYRRAEERQKRKKEREERWAHTPPKKEYLKKYYQEHKAEQAERNRRSRERAKAKKEQEKAKQKE